MFAEVVINIEATLDGTFHYHIPGDLEPKLTIGNLVEVEFGRRLAQGIIIALDITAPIEETKPIIALIEELPVVFPWQIRLAQWMSQQYLASLNACIRLMLPPGLTRWADMTVDLDPTWDGTGRLTEAQRQLVELLRQKGDMRGRQISRVLPKEVNWRSAISQLARRGILRKASVLDPPRVRPKLIGTAELIAGPTRIIEAAVELGRPNKAADVLYSLLINDDPLPAEDAILKSTGANATHLEKLEAEGLVVRGQPEQIVAPGSNEDWLDGPESAETVTKIIGRLPAPLSAFQDDQLIRQLSAQDIVQIVEQPANVGLKTNRKETVAHIYRLRGGQKYYDVLMFLTQVATAMPVKDLLAATGATMDLLRKLANLDLIRFGSREIWRDSLADRDFVTSNAPTLTADQEQVWNSVKAAMSQAEEHPAKTDKRGATTSSPKPFLLHGVTGSGKTEIYMRAVEQALQKGQKAIVLVPEIALTPQTVRRFAARFPGRVAILHSRLSDGERYDTWRRARDGQFDIVIGPRSALFTPFADLGVVVIDEEHDHSYKQASPVLPPFYHARDAAIRVGQSTGATVIMGSATPDVVTYHRSQAGEYHLLELPRRIMGHRSRITDQEARLSRNSRYQQAAEDPVDAMTIPLPPVQVVDLRQELRAGNRSIFSRALKLSITEALDRNEQVILFLNRRGTATFVMCRDCGHVLDCPRCEMPLTYHRPGMMLVCHHCGRHEPQHEQCPRCHSERIKYFGLGTEEVERRVQLEWPAARTVRWDRDTTAGRDSHEEILASFINHEADILVGTQMIAKGLDMPLVTLVGVISADVSLGLPDYRIGERTFQILAQVAGRAGRGLLGGKVIFQTYQPEHYAIATAAEHDYTGFYLTEIRFRTQHGLPPFRRLAKLVVADPVNGRAKEQAHQLAKALALRVRELALGATELIGPVPPFFSRLDGRYRWQIIVRSPDPVRLLRDFPTPPNWILDVDPVSTL